MSPKTIPEPREELRASATTPDTSFTWRGLAGHWLRTSPAHETEALARRRAAVQRWRGLPTEKAACLKGCNS